MSDYELNDPVIEANLIDRIGDLLVYLYIRNTKTRGFKGRIEFQYGPGRVTVAETSGKDVEKVRASLMESYTAIGRKVKNEGHYTLGHISEMMADGWA